jgi:hypothetical protein
MGHCKHSLNRSRAGASLRAVLPVFRENVADDLLGNGLLRRQKQVVHDHVVAVLHGHRRKLRRADTRGSRAT